jgi:ABC-type branched-subunit amino acid transport system substrate-binding protein
LRVGGAAGTLRLGILVETSGSMFANKSVLGAALLAIAEVNRRADELGSKALEYAVVDGGCSASNSAAALSSLLFGDRLDALIGPGCSTGCESTAFTTAGLNIPQISYGCTSESLADSTKYPTVRHTTTK